MAPYKMNRLKNSSLTLFVKKTGESILAMVSNWYIVCDPRKLFTFIFDQGKGENLKAAAIGQVYRTGI